jgi:D-lactate dehydrogenase
MIQLFELNPAHADYFHPLAVQHTPAPLTANNVSDFAAATIISTLNESDLRPAVLDQLPQLRHIASRTTGIDHIPLAYCARRGITVSNVPHYGQHTVAEFAFGLLLTLSRRLREELARPPQGSWSPKSPPGFDLYGKTMGVIGAGNIGQRSIQMAKGFGMRVVAYDIAPVPGLEAQLGFQYVSKAELLAHSDIVTLHVPGDETTRHLIGAVELAAMKPGAVLVNTARGSVVDIVALADSLLQGHLGGACLDTLPQEDVLRNPAGWPELLHAQDRTAQEVLAIQLLLTRPNVVIAPHVAYNTTEAMTRILNTTRENIEQALAVGMVKS